LTEEQSIIAAPNAEKMLLLEEMEEKLIGLEKGISILHFLIFHEGIFFSFIVGKIHFFYRKVFKASFIKKHVKNTFFRYKKGIKFYLKTYLKTREKREEYNQ
jgi:hypothetical protein